MSRSIKIYIAILLLFLIGVVYMDSNKPKPIDWTESFDISEKKPFGLYVFNDNIDAFFKPNTLTRVRNTPYEYFDNHYTYDYETKVSSYDISGTFVHINSNDVIDAASWDEIKLFVSHGNQAFISSSYFNNALTSILNFNTAMNHRIQDTLSVSTYHSPEKYKMKQNVVSQYFKKIDSTTTTILGYEYIRKDSLPNFIKVNYGNGAFFLHTQPLAFTNYYMLTEGHEQYVSALLNYIPKSDIFWYENKREGGHISGSKLRFIFNNPALKWAYYILIFGLILFIIFNAKRKQRVVPIIKPLENTTIAFAKTIGNLYFQEGDHHDIIAKKIKYFLEKIRSEYYINTHKIDQEFIKQLQLKTGKELTDIEHLAKLILSHNKRNQSTPEDLLAIHLAIEKVTSKK